VADAHGAWTNGTEGDDVIVGDGPVSSAINALGGNDIICINEGNVYAGDGDDSVVVIGSDPEKLVDVTLGAGDDRFVGGPGQDYVDHDNGMPGTGIYSPGTDVIFTGAGSDTVGSRPPNEPNHDIVDLGSGPDWLSLDLPAGSAAQVEGGTGGDHMDLAGAAADYAVDLGTGAVTRAGVEAASFSGFEEYWLWVVGPGALRVVGTPGRDAMVVDADRLDLRTGSGRDTIQIDALPDGSPGLPVSGVVDLGPGRDRLEAGADRLMVADLTQGLLMLENVSRQGRLDLLGVEDLNGGAQRIVMRGGPGSNMLRGFGCQVRLQGGAGADHLHAGPWLHRRSTCHAVLAGGAGRDVMSGREGNDRLLGGPGTDVAHGRQGIDTCSAERQTSCERQANGRLFIGAA
jgi:Ca2+-binding RTX toxin-like protein